MMFHPRLSSRKFKKQRTLMHQKVYSSFIKYSKISNDASSGQVKYLSQICDCPAFENSDGCYIHDGKVFVQDLLEALAKAEKFIFLQFFIIEDGFLLNEVLAILIAKASMNVDVRIIFDDIGSLGKISKATYEKIKNSKVKIVRFNKVIPVFSAIYNNRNHQKMVIVDGTICYTGGMNLTDDILNIRPKYGFWQDAALKMEGEVVKSFVMLFLENYLASTNKVEEVDHFFKEPTKNYQNQILLQPFFDSPRPLDTEYVSETVYLNMINQAKEYLYIVTPYFIVDYTMLNALKMAAKRGVKVVILTPHIPDKKMILLMTRSYYQQLILAGISVYEYTPGFMHSKIIISDDLHAVVGSINFDFRSLCHHFECGVFIESRQLVRQIKEHLLNDLAKSELISLQRAKQLTKHHLLTITLLKILAPLL